MTDSLRRHSFTLSPEDRYQAYNALYCEYESFQFDSAFRYAAILREIAREVKDPAMLVDSKMKYAYALSKGGLFKESLDSLVIDDIDRLGIPDSLKNDYYITLGRIYHHLSDYTAKQTFTSLYEQQGNEALEKALRYYSRDSVEKYWLRGKIHYKSGRLDEAYDNYKYAVDHFPTSDPMAAILYSTLGSIERMRGNFDKAIDFFMISAGINIRRSNTETVSFQSLAELLFYEKGEVGKAAEFINLAIEDANAFSARQRKQTIASLMPVIIGEKVADIEQKKATLERNFVTIVVMTVLLIVLFVFMLVQMKRIRESRTVLQQLNVRLLESNRIKEQYVGHYFHINSMVADQINRFAKVALRKLEDKQYAGLESLISNLGRMADKEIIYADFDRTFLKLFPAFVEDFNALLKPQDRMTVPEHALNPTMRIFAIIRLGITDSEQIANILDYSLNTIYNYRTRVRNKAIVPSEEFEDRVRQIGML